MPIIFHRDRREKSFLLRNFNALAKPIEFDTDKTYYIIEPTGDSFDASDWVDDCLNAIDRTFIDRDDVIILIHIAEIVEILEDKILKVFDKYGYDHRKFLFVFATDPEWSKPVKTLNCKVFPSYWLYYWSLVNDFSTDPSNNLVSKIFNYRRAKKYLFLNHITKSTRRYALVKLEQAGLLDDGIVSYLNLSYDEEPATVEKLENDAFFTPLVYPYLCEHREIEKRLPIILDNPDRINNHRLNHIDFFKNSYWSLVGETYFRSKYFLTEKTFKCLFNMHPFILIGPNDSLKYLHEYGFKTFGDYIDESYDTFTDHQTRLDAAINEAIRIFRLGHHEQLKLMKQVTPILEHNKKHAQDINFLSRLINEIPKGTAVYHS